MFMVVTKFTLNLTPAAEISSLLAAQVNKRIFFPHYTNNIISLKNQHKATTLLNTCVSMPDNNLPETFILNSINSALCKNKYHCYGIYNTNANTHNRIKD